MEATTAPSIQYTLQTGDQLCFVRIPKTGSTTLISILDAKFNIEEICPIMAGDLPRADASELSAYKFFRGHFDYDLCSYLPGHQVYLTMLRHPIDRAVSYYEFCKRCQIDRPFDQYLKQEAQAGIAAFTTHSDPTIRLRTSNCQTRYIASGLGGRHGQPFVASPLESQYSDAELLELAKAHLDQFAFVGLTERFQDSILLLSYIFGWQPITEYQNLRVTAKKPKRNELDPATIEAISSVNQLDLELYHYAEQLFQDRFNQMLSELQAQGLLPTGFRSDTSPTQQQQLVDALEQHYHQRYRALNLPPLTSINFDFLQAMSGSGWHRRNGIHSGLRSDAVPFRWTGPSTESTLDLPLATETDLTIRIRLINSADSSLLDSFRLKVNQHLIRLDLFLRRGTVAVFQGTIPQAVLAQGQPFSRLTLMVDRTISLQEANPDSTDNRVVGVAVHLIQIFPAVEAQPDSDKYFLLPHYDSAWIEAADFIQQRLAPHERIAAPLEFTERFPDRFCSYLQDFTDRPDLDWVVVHKDSIDEIHSASLDWVTQKFQPVFANEVFLIFSKQPHAPIDNYFLFAQYDPAWTEAADFLQQRLQSAERIAAPIEFAERFPGHFCFYSQTFIKRPDLNWVVVHKDSIDEIHPASLDWVVQNFRPVFANDVFLIFSQRRDYPQVSIRSNHLRAFWKTWIKLKLLNWIDRQPQLIKLLQRFGISGLSATLGRADRLGAK